MRIGLLGTLAVHDEGGQSVQVGGHRVRFNRKGQMLDAKTGRTMWLR